MGFFLPREHIIFIFCVHKTWFLFVRICSWICWSHVLVYHLFIIMFICDLVVCFMYKHFIMGSEKYVKSERAPWPN